MLVTVVLVIRIYTLVQMRLYTLHLGGTVYHDQTTILLLATISQTTSL